MRLFASRKYRSGSRWALWRWTDVDSGYIVRLHLIMCPWFAICLHWFQRPDPEPHLHDHPVSFLSLILRGWYVERTWKRVGKGRARQADELRRWWNWIPASEDHRHRIEAICPGTLTLCFMSGKKREWGFHTEDGWVHWKDYYREQRAMAA